MKFLKRLFKEKFYFYSISYQYKHKDGVYKGNFRGSFNFKINNSQDFEYTMNHILKHSLDFIEDPEIDNLVILSVNYLGLAKS